MTDMNRAAWLTTEIRRLTRLRDANLDPFYNEIERLQNNIKEIGERYDKDIAHRADELEAWHLACTLEDEKYPRTVQLPGGASKVTAQKPRLRITDPKRFVEFAKEHGLDDLVREKTIEAPEVAEVKKFFADLVSGYRPKRPGEEMETNVPALSVEWPMPGHAFDIAEGDTPEDGENIG